MPLQSVLNGAKQCTATSKRSKLRCNNPAAYGCRTCRMHGARKKSSIKSGDQHPLYVHGGRTKENIERYAAKTKELRKLEELGFKLGLMRGSKTCGRKPNGYTKK